MVPKSGPVVHSPRGVKCNASRANETARRLAMKHLVLAFSLVAIYPCRAAGEIAFSQSATAVPVYDFVEVSLRA